jgi:hypothetical protein
MACHVKSTHNETLVHICLLNIILKWNKKKHNKKKKKKEKRKMKQQLKWVILFTILGTCLKEKLSAIKNPAPSINGIYLQASENP